MVKELQYYLRVTSQTEVWSRYPLCSSEIIFNQNSKMKDFYRKINTNLLQEEEMPKKHCTTMSNLQTHLPTSIELAFLIIFFSFTFLQGHLKCIRSVSRSCSQTAPWERENTTPPSTLAVPRKLHWLDSNHHASAPITSFSEYEAILLLY